MSQEGMRRLMAYHWPGNVRQLENVVERSIAFSQGRPQVEVQDLTSEAYSAAPAADTSADVAFPDEGVDFDRYIANIERALIKQSLDRTGGNKLQAARLLNLKRTTLVEKLKRLEPLN
jgi:DNA-binding NtrC family response regulator